MEVKTENTEGAGAEAAPVVKTPGVGDVAKQLIRDGLGNKEVLDKVKEQFPDAKTTMSSINWYRNHLRGIEEGIPTARELSQAGKPSSAEAKAEKAAAKQKEKDDKAAKAAADKEAKAKEKADAKALADKEKADKKAAEKAAAAEKKAAAKADAKPAAGAEGELDAALA